MKDPYEKEKEFKKLYCEQNKFFGLIENQPWAITGMFAAFFAGLLGAFVGEADTLGYIGFVIGAAINYFMQKEYQSELEKFRQNRSTWNFKIDDE